MPRLAALIVALSLLGCRTPPLDFDGGAPGGSSDLAVAGHPHDLSGGPDLTATPTSCCGVEGNPGNEDGVGKFCQTSTDCASLKANICATSFAPNLTFCTMACMTDGSQTECGSGAECQCAQNQCACIPGECVMPPPGCYDRRVRPILVLALVAGCGSSAQNPATDMAAPSGERDLSVGEDLRVPPTDLGAVPPVDLAGWCVGTTLAGVDADGGATGLGECARQYFLQLADCFRPADGCGSFFHTTGDEFCWDDGAGAHLRGVDVGWFEEWWMPDRICMFDQPHDFQDPTGQLDFCMSSATGQCGLHSDGGGLQHASYDSGLFTCPDGTQVMIDLAGCPALNALLQPTPICVGPSNCTPMTQMVP